MCSSDLVFGDDGEKFGTWPGTKEHVYDRGWLTQFFDALQQNADWLRLTTPTEAIEAVLESFESRDEYLEEVPVADTVLVIQAIVERRGIAPPALSSELLPR